MSAKSTVLSSVAASAVSVVLLTPDTHRVGATFVNKSDKILYVTLGKVADDNGAPVAALSAGMSGYYELPYGFTGTVSGIWEAGATGTVEITEAMDYYPAPANDVAPSLSGSGAAGTDLIVDDGEWSAEGGGIILSHQWFADAVAITGQTSGTYRVKVADAGKDITCKVTAKCGLLSTTVETAAVTAS